MELKISARSFLIINKPRNRVRSIFKYLYHTLQTRCIRENFIYVIDKNQNKLY